MGTGDEVWFGPFRLDRANACVWRGPTPVRLTPKAFDLLRYLVTHAGRLVTREELWPAVWPGTVVSEAALTVCMAELRRALGEETRAPRWIETVPRRGYRFIAPVLVEAAPPTAFSAPGAALPRSAAPAVPLSGPPPGMVGRAAELQRLQEWFGQAQGGARRVVFVTGEPGLGKTTLVQAFLAWAAAQGAPWLAWGQCIEHYGVGEAYQPVLEALGQLGRGAGGAELVAPLAQYAPTWLVQLPALLQDEELAAVQRRVQGATPARMLRELTDVLEALTVARPLVLVLEDLHWSDAATVELLAALARRRDPARLLVLGTYRPVEVILRGHPLRGMIQELALHQLCAMLPLELFSMAEVGQYLVVRLGGGAAVGADLPALARALHRRTDGHPLFMVHVVADWVARGLLVERGGQWVWTIDAAAVPAAVPASLQQLIEQQLEALSTEEQLVLEAASVAGVAWSAAAVAAGVGDEVEPVAERCARLARRRQFLLASGVAEWPDGTVADCYQFRHALYQQVVYDRLPAGRRRELHHAIGLREEAGYGAQAAEHAAELAEHFERGRDEARAVHYHQLAAETALRRWAYQEAVGHLTRGLAHLQRLPDTPERTQKELALQSMLGPAVMLTRGFAASEVERAYRRALELCQQLGDTPHLFPVLAGLRECVSVQGQSQAAYDLGEQLLTLAQQAQDRTLLLQAHQALGGTLYHRGELVAARSHLEQGLALYRPEEHLADAVRSDQDPGLACVRYAALTLWLLGYPDQSQQRSQQALALAQASRHPPSLAAALVIAARVHQHRGEGSLARERAEATVTLACE
jgi:predicted ATPase/DNA-binding winged helix-turn-helix (wHTH) protein